MWQQRVLKKTGGGAGTIQTSLSMLLSVRFITLRFASAWRGLSSLQHPVVLVSCSLLFNRILDEFIFAGLALIVPLLASLLVVSCSTYLPRVLHRCCSPLAVFSNPSLQSSSLLCCIWSFSLTGALPVSECPSCRTEVEVEPLGAAVSREIESHDRSGFWPGVLSSPLAACGVCLNVWHPTAVAES